MSRNKKRLIGPGLLASLTIYLSTVAAIAQLGSNVPTDQQLQQKRAQEVTSGFVVPAPPAGKVLRPVERVPRNKFGVVGNIPLVLQDLDALVYPSLTSSDRQLLVEGMSFFTTPHTLEEGAGPMNNQPFCLGCHESTAEQPAIPGVVNPDTCIPGSSCISLVSRAARSSPTNFQFTGFDPSTGAGRAPDHLDAIHDTGKTASFTTFGDFSAALNAFDPLDGVFVNPVTHSTQAFGGFVQHVRPAFTACLPKPLPSVEADANLVGLDDTNLSSLGFRRSVGERAGPPYIGRGLMEAVPTGDILANEDPQDLFRHSSSLGNFAAGLGCAGDCIAGRHNEIPAKGGFVGGVGRFGLRANGVEILQFTTGGLQGELSFTSLLNMNEINLAPINLLQPGCSIQPHGPEVHLSVPFSERNFIRNTAPPEFGDALLNVLQSPHPDKHHQPNSAEGKVQRGAELFGIDLVAFADRMIPGRMPASGDDGLDPHAINQQDRMLNCVSCHTPIQRTGQSPAEVGSENLSFVWAPIFSDLLLHQMPVIDAERFSIRPRDPFVISRLFEGLATGDDDDDRRRSNDDGGDDQRARRLFATFDMSRNLADDTFSNQQGSATGRDFRTAPLMGLGRMGTPFLHDARVFLSRLTVDSAPAGTVTTNKKATNTPLVVRTLDDAIRAAIELHDLPAPDDERTPKIPGAGCPVPPAGAKTNVAYGSSPEKVICPAYDSEVSKTHRSEAREVIRRFRALSPADQQALIEFLKQL
jgi:Di-haem oxidoreductase, putative peroxidase